MPPDVTAKNLERDIAAVRRCKNTLDCSADVFCGVNQGAVYIEQINRKRRYHTHRCKLTAHG